MNIVNFKIIDLISDSPARKMSSILENYDIFDIKRFFRFDFNVILPLNSIIIESVRNEYNNINI